MKIFLAGPVPYYNEFVYVDPPFVLESYYYLRGKAGQKVMEYVDSKPKENFLLDSGAFTYMSDGKKAVDFDQYIREYAQFIIDHGVTQFFELDIDSIVGIKKVEEYRAYLENKTKRKCIPVWHKGRGLEYWKKMTEEYDYVAIGGIVTKEIKKSEYKYFKPLLEIAKQNGCKVHGLGYTNADVGKYDFYSVDSTTWTAGLRFGRIPIWDSIKKGMGQRKEHDKRIKTELRREVAKFSLAEWKKFVLYMEGIS